MITKLRKTLYLLIIMAAFMSISMGPGKNTGEVQKEHIVWPPPPWEPRIEFLYSITTPDDFQIKKGFFRRVWEFVAGESREGLIKPFGIFADDNGRLYVTDTADQSVHVFDPKDSKYFVIEGVSKKTRLSSPIDVAVDNEGNIYISDSVMRRVYVFNKMGKFLREIGSDNVMQRPTGIAIDNMSGALYVVDTLASKIFVYSLDGKYIKTIGGYGGGNGEFNRPTFIALGRDGNLYITDTMNIRVQIIDKQGKFVGKFGRRGNAAGDLANPRGIALDSEGHIYITDTLFEAVTILVHSQRFTVHSN
ncbi:MAG: SMP-30/gluconolactonase/LRE family protein [Nitrospirae bacterium]|nr:SMP-30/gluconolactonase/LRE family protein [Nitrospirota bacterium]